MKRVILLAVVALVAGNSCAIREKPVLNVADAPIVADESGSVAVKIKDTLKARRWKVIDEEPGTIVANFSKANDDIGQHSVTIRITYDADSYSINYVDSENMLYDEVTGTIHRNYNRWIANLQRDLAGAF